MSTPAPYTFPHKSRAAMVDYILSRDSRSYHFQTYKFCWNVKTYGADFDGDSLRVHFPDLEKRFDSDWSERMDSDEYFFGMICEDAARHITEDGWTSFPGSDQGDWEFGFEGRGGGWLVLLKWRGRDVTELYDSGDGESDESDDLASWEWTEIRAFYRGIRTADSDFTPEKAAQEVEYQAAFQRECWEDGLRDDLDAAAAAMASSMETARPDLYQEESARV